MRVLPRVTAVVLALWGAGCGTGGRMEPDLPMELSPSLARVEALGGRVVYFNGAAFPMLVKLGPSWLAAEDRSLGSERVKSLAQAALNPKLFRQLDRQERFDVLLLAGDPVQFRPLMEHLNRTRDWGLDRVDPWCMVFKRGSEDGISKESLWGVVREWEGRPRAVRAAAVAAMAERLVAASRLDAAGELVEEAKRVDAGNPAVCAVEGWYRLARGEWKQAVAAADRGLKANRRHRPSLSVKAQGLYFLRNYLAAYDLSRELLEESPEDPVMLFTHAKIAHEVKSLKEEIEILEKLIAIATREKRSTSWYEVYLGQALASTGRGEEALESFERALADPELPPDQRDFAKSARAKVALKVRPSGEESAGKK